MLTELNYEVFSDFQNEIYIHKKIKFSYKCKLFKKNVNMSLTVHLQHFRYNCQ